MGMRGFGFSLAFGGIYVILWLSLPSGTRSQKAPLNGELPPRAAEGLYLIARSQSRNGLTYLTIKSNRPSRKFPHAIFFIPPPLSAYSR